MLNNVFTIDNLSFAYSQKKILDNLSVEIEKDKITTLIGANGSGKSTLFNLMTRNLVPDSGEIKLYGKSIREWKMKEYAKEVSIVHQNNTAPGDLIVEKLVSYGRTPYHNLGIAKNPEEDEKKIQWALEITDTVDFKDYPISSLSGGQRQRVWIAMALAQGTKILFLDEPTTYLDVKYQLDILHLVKKLNREFHITIIMVLHDMNQSIYYSDNIIGMKNGKIIVSGKAEDVISTQTVRDIYDVSLEVESRDGKPFVIAV